MKQCTICLENKPLDAYGKDKKSPSGHSSQCKECRSIRKRARYKNDSKARAEERERQRLYYIRHREHLKEKVRLYQIANAVERLEYDKTYRSQPENIRRANERSKKYRSNPENKAILAHRQMQYNYRKLKAPGFSTKQQLKWRWEYYGGMCWICPNEATEFDHVKPLTKGGSNWPGNLKPICRSCNARKSNKWPYKPEAIRS